MSDAERDALDRVVAECARVDVELDEEGDREIDYDLNDLEFSEPGWFEVARETSGGGSISKDHLYYSSHKFRVNPWGSIRPQSRRRPGFPSPSLPTKPLRHRHNPDSWSQ